ncbi:MAG: pyruvate kinase [Actinomycetota bacterium]|nr:pyruvate kinase [Actinomycetota bacterium]
MNQHQRRTKIVCTLGPATQSPDAIAGLVAAGMDVARLNFSHGSRDDHAEIYGRVRDASDAAGRAVSILVDLQGPKIRLGCFDGGFAVLEPGSVFTVTAEQPHGAVEALAGSSRGASTTYGALARDLSPGDTILIDDGLIKLTAISSDGTEVACRVIEGGLVSDRKGINLPGARVSAPALTDKDAEDLRFALALGVDLVALSYVRRPEDADIVRHAMEAAGRRVPVIAKLEKAEAVENLTEIVDAFDGVMVARGDLGVETPMEQVPQVQKRAVTLARERAKPAIVATQMLESMRVHSRPTRAEVSDVANAVLDGADALMLSAETSVGEHAREAVATMARIIAATEEGTDFPVIEPANATSEEAIAATAPQLARAVNARALVAFTQTGATARRIAAQRPPVPVLAFTPVAAVRSRLTLTWGVETFVAPLSGHLEDMVTQVADTVLSCGRIRWGDAVVIVAGSLQGRSGATDLIRVLQLDTPGDFHARISA